MQQIFVIIFVFTKAERVITIHLKNRKPDMAGFFEECEQ